VINGFKKNKNGIYRHSINTITSRMRKTRKLRGSMSCDGSTIGRNRKTRIVEAMPAVSPTIQPSWGDITPDSSLKSLSEPTISIKTKDTHPLSTSISSDPSSLKTRQNCPLKILKEFQSSMLLRPNFFKVFDNGFIPSQPFIIKAKFFSKIAERKIKAVGGARVLTG
jgi:hypothetical protein